MKRNCVCASWFFCFPSVKALHCISLLNGATLKLPVFCCSATLMWRRRTASNCRHFTLLLFLWSEIVFAQVDSFAFLQSMYSAAFICLGRPPWSLPSFAAVQRWCEGEGRPVIAATLHCYCFYEAKLCLRKLMLCFTSVKTLHCIGLLKVATLKFAIFCCSATLI